MRDADRRETNPRSKNGGLNRCPPSRVMSACFTIKCGTAAPRTTQTRCVTWVPWSTAQRVVAQRLYPFIDYLMPDYVWEDADKRMQRFLGRHGKGPMDDFA